MQRGCCYGRKDFGKGQLQTQEDPWGQVEALAPPIHPQLLDHAPALPRNVAFHTIPLRHPRDRTLQPYAMFHCPMAPPSPDGTTPAQVPSPDQIPWICL